MIKTGINFTKSDNDTFEIVARGYNGKSWLTIIISNIEQFYALPALDVALEKWLLMRAENKRIVDSNFFATVPGDGGKSTCKLCHDYYCSQCPISSYEHRNCAILDCNCAILDCPPAYHDYQLARAANCASDASDAAEGMIDRIEAAMIAEQLQLGGPDDG